MGGIRGLLHIILHVNKIIEISFNLGLPCAGFNLIVNDFIDNMVDQIKEKLFFFDFAGVYNVFIEKI
jgi:hypothetical protein